VAKISGFHTSLCDAQPRMRHTLFGLNHRRGGVVKKTLYETLEIPSNASPTAIESAYRRLQQQCYERAKVDPTATDDLKVISLAYDLIRDPVQRSMYDQRMAQINARAALLAAEKQSTAKGHLPVAGGAEASSGLMPVSGTGA
jgi:curved DNA-binding protein CbpA